MRISVRLFGVPVLAVDWGGCDCDCEDEEEEEGPRPIWSGNSATGGLIERDNNPLSPDDRYAPWDDEEYERKRRFGFQP